MNERTLYYVGPYTTPFPTADDRDRTIAAMFVAQDTRKLGAGEMRRDVLTHLNGATMVGHWLKKGRLEVVRTVGSVAYLRLTAAGLNECFGKHKPIANIERWMTLMTRGGPGTQNAKSFSLA